MLSQLQNKAPAPFHGRKPCQLPKLRARDPISMGVHNNAGSHGTAATPGSASGKVVSHKDVEEAERSADTAISRLRAQLAEFEKIKPLNIRKGEERKKQSELIADREEKEMMTERMGQQNMAANDEIRNLWDVRGDRALQNIKERNSGDF